MLRGPGVGRETGVRYKMRGSTEMTDTSMVRVVASPHESMVRESSATAVNTAMRIPFRRSSRLRRFLWRCHLLVIVEQVMAMRNRNCEVAYSQCSGNRRGRIKPLGGGTDSF